jgi:hypothetical protein
MTNEATVQGAETGTIYVLRSQSNHSYLAQHRDLIHKIGVTGGEVSLRVSNAKADPTFLFADVDIVATYRLININRAKLEALLHRFFAAARLDVEIPDRFGRAVKPREWFFVPLHIVDEVVARIKDQSITHYVYDPSKAELAKR